MKSFILGLCFLGLTTVSFSQVRKEDQTMKMEELPEVVIKSAGKDFSIYLPDKNPDKDVVRLEKEFVAYDLGKDYQGFESYLLVMETKSGSLSATYNQNGKLTSVVEDYKNVRLPSAVIYAVYKTFPGWKMVKDKFLYTQEDGDIIKKQYNIKIKKGKSVRRLVVHPNGDIVKGV